MKELIKMWENTRMIVLVALSAGLYVAILIPFKAIPVIPGFTELRPANVIPVICSLMFGPAAAWGAAFGNLIGDFFGTFGLGSIFGFFGNFLYGFIPYKIWRSIISSEIEPDIGSTRSVAKFIFASFIASITCALVIGWGVDLLGFVPFVVLGNIIFFNNFIVSIILGPILLKILYPRVKKWGLLYTQIMKPEEISSSRFYTLGLILLLIGSIVGFLTGNFIEVSCILPFIILIFVSILFL